MNSRSSSGAPAHVLIIRHAEKPGDPGTDTDSDGRDLSPRGYARAAALAVQFTAKFPRPDYLFATRPSAHSNRPVETVTPLAQALGLSVNADYRDAEYGGLAQEILGDAGYADKTVLVCWHHGKIPQLAAALGVSDPPAHWPAQVFDRVWRLDFGAGTVTLTDLPQGLLDGDTGA